MLNARTSNTRDTVARFESAGLDVAREGSRDFLVARRNKGGHGIWPIIPHRSPFLQPVLVYYLTI
jgi:hypothetical protein